MPSMRSVVALGWNSAEEVPHNRACRLDRAPGGTGPGLARAIPRESSAQLLFNRPVLRYRPVAAVDADRVAAN